VPLRDAIEVLDHRSRGRTIPRNHAPAGHYLALDGAAGEHLLPIDGRVLHLGRAMTADVQLEDARVSRCHAIVVRSGNEVRLLDDRSLSGTYVNGERIVSAELADGDTICLGPIELTYVTVD
jgi:pSer/pThr/pTyr-binding forkhead associated (FHA) protein